MLLTLLPLALFAQFPGGSANDLCAQLATETKRPVVVVKNSIANIAPFQYDPADLDSINRALRSKVAMELTAGSDVIVHDGRIPAQRLGSTRFEKPLTPKWVLPKIEEGKVDLQTAGQEALDPAELEEAKFSKPLKVHWFYEKTPVCIQASKLPERDFLTFIAKGVGAKFIETHKEFRLDFDPSAMRNRMIKSVGIFQDLWAKRQEATEEENSLMTTARPIIVKAMLSDISLGELTEAFRTPEGKSQFKLRPNGATTKACFNVLDTYLIETSKGAGKVKFPTGEFTLPLRPDSAKPMTATLTAKFGSSFKLTVVDANNQSLGDLGFEFDGLEY